MTIQILSGDARETLKGVPDKSVHVTVTSPPYWGLRSYIDDPREIGRESTPEEHINNLLQVFREVHRVMRDDGVMFVNYGDAYASSGVSHVAHDGLNEYERNRSGRDNGPKHQAKITGRAPTTAGYKPKDLLSMPFRVAEALREDGWYHRSTICWAKKSPMPESVRGSRWERCRAKVGRQPVDRSKSPAGWDHGEGAHDTIPKGNYAKDGDREATVAVWKDCPGCDKCADTNGYIYRMNAGRPTNSHEYVFMFSKSSSYFYNQDGNRVAQSEASLNRYKYSVQDVRSGSTKGQRECGEYGLRDAPQRELNANPAGRNLWTVWDDIKQSSYKGAHFAVFPIKLAERCIKLGTSDYGCCPECGNQYAPVVDTERVATRPATDNKRVGVEAGNTDPERHDTTTSVSDWWPTCSCSPVLEGKPVVLDPFHGSGTTGEAARECGCAYIGCELNEEYIKLGNKRFEQSVLF